MTTSILAKRDPVHPHMRGDGPNGLLLGSARRGSPPHAWGRRSVSIIFPTPSRFTPTCVGTAQIITAQGANLPRFTPTCVGTASWAARPTTTCSVHPHMRGDGHFGRVAIEATDGSPPHAWGRLRPIPETPTLMRFTPTCVGTASSRWLSMTWGSVHPHMRGDGFAPRRPAFDRLGSPPHAWGRQLAPVGIHAVERFTPTCVGTAGLTPVLWPSRSVHPHMRGDGNTAGDVVRTPTGSPPHAWGRPPRRAPAAPGSRFTPTCVGTAAPALTTLMPNTVHPHMRGDGF